MPWYRRDTGVKKHVKTYKLARALTLNRREAVGLLDDLWSWAQEASIPDDGCLADFTPEEICDAIGWNGDPAQFVESFVGSGYLDRDPETGCLAVHDWYDWNGRANEKRRRDAARKRAERGLSTGRSAGQSTDAGADRRAHTDTETDTARNQTTAASVVADNPRTVHGTSISYITRCVVALNRGLADNEHLEGYREIVASSQTDAVSWEGDGIPIETAESVVRDLAIRYRPKAGNRQPHSLRYFDAAVREAWALHGQDNESHLLEKLKKVASG